MSSDWITHMFTCAADGNKNVSELVYYQRARGVAAHYEYAPFGGVTARTRGNGWGTLDFSVLNPFRFSSEFADDALGLVYYNYRHYEPIMGRWLSRDPMEQQETVVLYGFCDNGAGEWCDVLGLEKKKLRYETDPFENQWARRKYSEFSNNEFKHEPDIEKVIADIEAETDPYCPEGEQNGDAKCCHCIEEIRIAGHGEPGYLDLGNAQFNIVTPDEKKSAIYKSLHGEKIPSSSALMIGLLSTIKARLCANATVEFITCETGADPGAKRLLQQYFGPDTRIVLYSCPVKLVGNEVIPQRSKKRSPKSKKHSPGLGGSQ